MSSARGDRVSSFSSPKHLSVQVHQSRSSAIPSLSPSNYIQSHISNTLPLYYGLASPAFAGHPKFFRQNAQVGSGVGGNKFAIGQDPLLVQEYLPEDYLSVTEGSPIWNVY